MKPPKISKRRQSRQHIVNERLKESQKPRQPAGECCGSGSCNNPNCRGLDKDRVRTEESSFSDQSEHAGSYRTFQQQPASSSLYSSTYQSQLPMYAIRAPCVSSPFYNRPSEMSTLESVHKKLDRLLIDSTQSSSPESPFPIEVNSVNSTFAQSKSIEEIATFYPRSQPLAPLGVFWDIENCSVPKGKSALVAVQRIRERFFSGYMEAEFLCVCDIRKESPQVIQELNDAQVSVVHVSGNSKNAADDKLRQAMRRYADVYTSAGAGMFSQNPPSILLISGDVNFSTDLSDLRYRKRLYVILLHNTHAPDALLVCAHEHYNFHSILQDLPDRTVHIRKTFIDDPKVIPLKGGHCPMDIVVSDLPCIKNMAKLKNRLRKLSDNCGGKIVTIQGQFAVLRFPNKEAALRASKRMNGEDVFGSKIRVIYSSQMEFRTPLSSQTQIHSTQNDQTALRVRTESKQLINIDQSSLLVEPDEESETSPACSKTTMTWKSTWSKPKRSDNELVVQQPQYSSELVYGSHSSTSNCQSVSSSPASSRDSSPISAHVNTAGASSLMAGVDHFALKKEVAALLRDVPSHTLPLFKFREMFEKRYRRSVSSSDLYRMKDVVSILDGCSSPTMSSSFSASGRTIFLLPDWQIDGDEAVEVYCQAHPPQLKGSASSHLGWAEKEIGALLPNVVIELKVFAENLYNLLESHDGGFPLLSFLDCYESEFAPLQKMHDGFGVPLEHIISCVPGVEITNGENGMKRAQLISSGDIPAMPQPLGAQLLQLSRELIDLLKTFPRCAVPFSKLIPAYHHHFGRQCRVADYGHLSLSALLQTLPSTIQIIGDTQNRVVTLCHRSQMKRFATDVLRVLKAHYGIKKQVQLDEFPDAYLQLFSKPFASEDYGLCFLSDLVTELVETSSLVTLVNDEYGKTCLAIPKRGQTSAELQKMRVFAIEVVDLLRHSVRCEIPFSKFIPSYHHHFGRQCRVSTFGFSKLVELLDAIPETVEIVVSNQDGSSEERIIRLTSSEQLKVIGGQIWNLVHKREQLGVETHVTELADLFSSEHGYSLRPELCGASNLRDLCLKLFQFINLQDDTIELVERDQMMMEDLAEAAKSITLEDAASSGDLRNNNHYYHRSNNYRSKNRSPVKISANFNPGTNNSYGHYSRWENTSPKMHQIPPLTILTPLSSPTYSPRPDDNNVFTFDRQVQAPLPLSPQVPQFYDMLMRDSGSPSVSPPLLWAYHPLVYPPPTPPGASPNMMMPTFTFSGPWNNSSAPTMLSSACYEHLQQK